ncbi:MAG: SpvB/TcaC N-terminal domain-containing protein [Candidatus Cyclobacteriaceae bacterium M3_2C_046]
MNTNNSPKQKEQDNSDLPSINLPQGGGAIRGIGEKFSANPVTGSGSLNIPLPLSPARALAPQLSLQYDSGQGNGPFGYGWNIPMAHISRKTSKGLPEYNDDKDVFLFADSEDLVPFLVENGTEWHHKQKPEDDDYTIFEYRPRIEGLFSRIEKWVSRTTGNTHWKTISKANVTAIYGRSEQARVFDPEDKRRVFQWMLEETYDARGNTINYNYKRENREGIDISLSYEGSRLTENVSFNHLYLKSVNYGNKSAGDADSFHYQLVFDYGEHDLMDPAWEEQQQWLVRKDPFSSFTSGFEIRQYRLCHRILLFHDFGQLAQNPVLVRSMDLSYHEHEKRTLLMSIQQKGYRKNKDKQKSKSFPPLEFAYSEPEMDDEVKNISPEYLDNLPYGVDGSTYQWLDLEGEGLPGIFTENNGGWYYKNNRGNGTFTPQRLMIEKPQPSWMMGFQPVLADIDADGVKELLLEGSTLNGYFSQQENEWLHFLPFESYPSNLFNNPDLKRIDLNGDGLPDLLISEDEVFTWYPSKGKAGFAEAKQINKVLNEEKGPRIVFSNPEQNIYLSDMTGDGLNDIVRIRNGAIAYWPNKGYGKFGAKVVMENAPWLDTTDHFDQTRIRMFDLDGTGTTDLLYVGHNSVQIWYNCSGNSWSEVYNIPSFPDTDNLSSLAVVDLLGTGTGCLVWSSGLPKNEERPLAYIDLMPKGKPYLMTSVTNNMGRETKLSYTSSTTFYLQDLREGNPWITRLHFPVHVLEKVTTIDHISSSQMVSSYKYHHGYYDGGEREFRGFGMVEQTDSELFGTYNPENELDMPPVLTKTWFHTGAFIKNGTISQQYHSEYFNGDIKAHDFPDSTIENATEMDFSQLGEAYRSLKGKILRQEIYALDGSEKEYVPYSLTESNFLVKQLQPGYEDKNGVFLTSASETLVYAYERNDQDPRITHSFILESDDYGQPLKTIEIAYPRRSTIDEAYPEQRQLYATLKTNTFFNETVDFYLIGAVTEQKSYELNGLEVSPDAYFSIKEINLQLHHVLDQSNILLHHQPFTNGVQARLLSWVKNFYWEDESSELPFGKVSALALPHHSEQINISTGWLGEVYDTRVDDTMMKTAGFEKADEHWWSIGATLYYQGPAAFYLPDKSVDRFGNESKVFYDQYFITTVRHEDAIGNVTTAEIDYYAIAPWRLTDINQNVTEVLTDPLGMAMVTSVYGSVNGSFRGDHPVNDYLEQEDARISNIIADPATFLQDVTSFFYYDLEAWMNDQQPPYFVSLLREQHASELDGEAPIIQVHLGYSDGFGRELQQKVKMVDDKTGQEQWLVTGRTVYNNKEKPVKQYEPFFSPVYAYQDEAAIAPVGVTPILYYDPLGRVYKTETAKGFYAKVIYDSWQVTTYDENDTVKDSAYYADHIGHNDDEAEALLKAEPHYNTPDVVHLDSLNRQFMSYQYMEEGSDPLATFSTFDVSGNLLTVTDPRQYSANQSRTADQKIHNFIHRYDLLGNILYTSSKDAGETWNLFNIKNNPVHSWNARHFHTEIIYDALDRPVLVKVAGGGINHMVQLMEYGEAEPDAELLNLRGQLIRHYDQAGLLEHTLFDINGQPLTSNRTLRKEYKTEVDWSDKSAVLMEPEVFTSETAYDALGRVNQSIQPDGSLTKPAYYPNGWLNSLAVQLKDENNYTSFIASIDYDPKGQRTRVIYGNEVHTDYFYEATTFRLTRLETTRQESNGSLTYLQDISYVYDPVGNIVKITDHSQEKVFTANQLVQPQSNFVYDALYQLKEATGREHLALSKTDYQQGSDVFKNTHFAHINDPDQLRNYIRQYDYDEAGNLVQIRHIGQNSFTRNVKVSDTSNRSISDEMDHTTPVEDYFDPAGNLLQLEHLQGIAWNYRNQIASVTIVERNGENDMEYYVYNASSQRTRKIKETYSSSGDLLWKEDKIYLGGVEIKRRYQGNSQTLQEDRSALHVMDVQQRIAMIYYWQVSSDSSVTVNENKIHYQLGNHLGSAALELDQEGQVISYEEYFPFGGTAFSAGINVTEVALKAYRYSGRERDDTTGLYYYGARYYAPWLGRWLNPDPAGTVDGLNLYRFVVNNPVKLVDIDGRQAGNSGKEIGLVEHEGVSYKMYEAVPGTWVSSSLKEEGYDQLYEQMTGYGAYEGVALGPNFQPLPDPDNIKIGQQYLIPVGSSINFSGVSITGQALPSTVRTNYSWSGDDLKHRTFRPRFFYSEPYSSFELDMPGVPPPSDDPREAVAFWLQTFSPEIIQAEKDFRVSRIAIAGAIAWEALENPLIASTSSVGPGKIHVEGSGGHSGWPEVVEQKGLVPTPGSDMERRFVLSLPASSIRYIGAIMSVIADEAEARNSGWYIRNNPEILTQVYHGSSYQQWKTNIANKPAGASFKIVPGMMSTWILDNQAYLEAAVGRPELQ